MPGDDRTLDELRLVLVPEIAGAAVFDGWTDAALDQAAVYFKSGSLFQCQPEEGFQCKAYHGNVINYMNSVAIIEQETAGVKLDYMVVLISNVLRKNSAVDHQTLATSVHQLMLQRHGIASP